MFETPSSTGRTSPGLPPARRSTLGEDARSGTLVPQAFPATYRRPPSCEARSHTNCSQSATTKLSGASFRRYRPSGDSTFNLETAEFQYYQPSRMAGYVMWRGIIACFTDSNLNVLSIADQTTDDANDKFLLAQRLNANLNQLRSILDLEFPEQVIPHDASLDDAIDVFDRVNSQGTKLSDAELALTHITGKWPHARRVMKKKIDECAAQHFNFGLTFMTRALTATVTGRALFETVHTRPRQELESGWSKLNRIMDYLINLLPHQAFIHSTDDLNTTNALIPITAYAHGSGRESLPPDVEVEVRGGGRGRMFAIRSCRRSHHINRSPTASSPSSTCSRTMTPEIPALFAEKHTPSSAPAAAVRPR